MAHLDSLLRSQPVQSTCPTYNGQLAGYKHGKSCYYQQTIEEYIQNQTRKVSAPKAWNYFNNGDIPWTQSVFERHYLRIRKSLNEGTATTVTLEPNAQTLTNEPTNEDCRAAIGALKKVID